MDAKKTVAHFVAKNRNKFYKKIMFNRIVLYQHNIGNQEITKVTFYDFWKVKGVGRKSLRDFFLIAKRQGVSLDKSWEFNLGGE